MSYSIRPIVRAKKKNAAGLCIIYFRVLMDDKDRLFSTNKLIDPQFFDNKTGKALKGANGMANINAFLTKMKSEIDDYIFALEREGRKVTIGLMEKFFNNEDTSSFIDFCFKELEANKSLMKLGNYRSHESQLRKLKKFAPDLTFADLQHSFLIKYRRYLLVEKKNAINTVHAEFRTMRKFVNMAIANKILKESPFKHFKLQKEEPRIEYLTLEEIKKLHTLYNERTLPKKLQSLLFYFLIGCYTGLRLGDIETNITQYIIDNKRFRINTGKTGKEVYFDLSTPVLSLLNSPDAFESPLIKYTRLAADIQLICLEVGVKKYITFHCSRHSFAINSLILGIDLFTVSQILGHRDIKTTMIYAKITEALLNNQMDKWNLVNS